MAGYFKRVQNYFPVFDVEQTTPSTGPPSVDSVYLDPKSVQVSREKYKLGVGTFAKVYPGTYRGQPCALKMFRKNALKYKEHLEEHDLAYLCDLKGPNIVEIYGLWRDPYKVRNALSLVMELCDTSLYEYIKSHKARGIPKKDKLKILHDVTNAMIYLHSKHIVHGDLRSPNVLLVNTRSRVESSDEQPQITAKVTDFDLARHIDPESLTHYTATFADEDYLPPEALDEDKKRILCLTFSVDVFCFGPLAIALACMEFPKPMVKVECKKGKVVKFRDEIERREKYLKKINFSERMYTDLIVKQCMADRPEERGSFLDLQLIIEAYQKKMEDRPDHELLVEKQAEIIEMRRRMEEDSKTLDGTETLKADLEAMTEAHEELLKRLQQAERDLFEVKVNLNVKLGQKDEEIKRIKKDWNLIIADKDEFYKEAIETKVRVQDLENQLSRQEKVNQDANRDRLNMNQQLRKTEEECKNLKRYRYQCRELEARLKEEEEKLRAAEEEKTKLNAKLLETEISLEESQAQLREEKDKMRRDNYELRETLERHLHLIEQKDRTIKTLQDKRQKHIQSLQAMEEKQRELKIKLNKQTKHFKQKETEWRAEIEKITKTFEPALNILETEHEELQRKVVSSKEVIRQKEQEIIELKRSKDTLSVEVQKKERELAELKKKLEAEIASREENQQRMKEYKATSEKMERLAGTLQSELSELTQLFTEQEASATAKQEELKEMLEVANKERIAFTEQMEQEERIQVELQKQLDKQREQWESEVSKADRLTERIHSLEIDLKKECVRSTELQARLGNVNRNMEREISGLQGEISHLEEENIQLKVDKQLFDLEKANFEAYRSTSMETEESTATVLTQLEEDNKMLSERCDSYKVERDRMCEERENLLAKLDQLKKKVETLEDQMRRLIAEKASLKDESDRWRKDSSELKIECDRSKSELLRLNQERRSLLTQQQELERERDKWMKKCKVLKELSSQRMVSSSSEEPVDLEDLERQEDGKRKVVQMQTDIDRLKELAGSMDGGSDSVDPNMSSTESDN